MRRITRTLITAASFTVIALAANVQETWARDGCYVCTNDCGPSLCSFFCGGGTPNYPCFQDEYGFCDDLEEGGNLILECIV